MTREQVSPEDIRVGDVIEIGPGAAWRKVTGVRLPTHPLAEASGAIVFDLVLWGHGRRMRALTVWPNHEITRTRTADEDVQS